MVTEEDREASALTAQLASLNGARLAVAADRAEVTEMTLRGLGLCNWLTDYSEVYRVYCGVPAVSDGLCSEHSHNMFLGG